MAAATEVRRADHLATHAAAELYEQHSRRVFGYCLSRLGRREDAEDATQLTFLHAVRGLRRGVVPAAESAWLFGIARNVCLSRWAATGRRSRVEEACDPAELERVAAGRDPHRDELIGLERALELLPEQQRRAVLLRDWRGLSYEEVAEALGVSRAAVEALIFRGRTALAEQLEEQRPAELRRRVHSLGELGSLLHAIKGALTGAATGAKLAAGVTAVVAVSAGGVALGVSADDPVPTRADAVPQRDPHAAAANIPTTPPAKSSPTRVAAVASAPATSTPAPVPAPVPAPAAEQRPDRGADTAVPAAAPVSTPAAEATVVAEPAPAASTPDAPVVEAPVAEAPVAEEPVVGAPLPPPAELPSTETVTAAIEPVVAVVEETVSSLPPLPALPELPPPTVPLPPLPGTAPLLP